MAQKLDSGAGMIIISTFLQSLLKHKCHNVFYSCFTEYLSIDGAIRVISDDFSISLLNPDSELYRYKADKYATMVRFFYDYYRGKAFD